MSNVYDSGLAYDFAGLTYDGATPSLFPAPGIFISFTDGPYVANPAWEDVTPYVRGFNTRRGKSGDYDNFGTGLAQVVLDNRDQRFSPFNTSGPFFGQLLPRRQIKIVGQINGVIYDVYRGYIAGWPVGYTEAGYDSTVTLQCFDALGLMVNETLPTDWADVYTRAANPIHYYKCNDSVGQTTLSDSMGLLNLSNVAPTPPFFEQPSLASGLIGSSAAIAAPGNGYNGTTTARTTDTNQRYWLTGWIQATNPVATTDIIFVSYQNNGKSLFFGIKSSNQVFVRDYNQTSVPDRQQTTFTPSVPIWNVPVHFAIEAGQGINQIYLNNVYQSWTTTANTVGPAIDEQVNIVGANVQEIAIFYSLTAQQRTDIYNAGLSRFTETTTARSNRLIGQTSFPALLTDFTPTPVGTVSEIGTNSGAVTELQKVSQSEGGDIFVTKAGLLKTTNRNYVYDNPASNLPQAIFSDAGLTGLNYGTELNLELDADSIRNDLTVTFTGGGQYSQVAAASIAAYGAASYSIETQLSNPTQAQALAAADITANAALKPKFSPLNVGVTVDPTEWQAILGLELLDCIEIVRAPAGGSTVDYRLLTYEIEHTVTPGVWETSLSGSARYSDWFTLDVSELDGPDQLL